MSRLLPSLFFLLILGFSAPHATQAPTPPTQAPAPPTHGVSTFGKLKYPADFTHFDYNNPNAPKGGTIRMGALGTFDSLNLFIVKGTPFGGSVLTHATLLDSTHDRSGEYYAYAAQFVEVAPDRSWVIFTLNPKAQFNNGEPITPEDVIFSFEALRDKGQPMFRTYYKNVSKVEKLDNHQIKFSFNTTQNRELPDILGQIFIFSKKHYSTVKFDETSLTPGPCSGPYEYAEIQPGRSVTLRRVKNWWGENVPSQKGSHNFDQIRFDYYLDKNAIFEAFKSGAIDIRQETTPQFWATGYDFPAVNQGFVKREIVPTSLSSGTYGLFFNTRRPIFADIRVRRALTIAFDFGWTNKNLFYGLFKRNLSYFPRSDFESSGIPQGEELALLTEFKDKLPAELFEKPYILPEPTTEAEVRTILLEAKKILQEAGWKSGQTFEILLFDKTLERVALHFQQILKRIDINVKVRTIDVSTYEERVTNFDYDMIFGTILQSASLGNEQRDFFGSERANAPGTRNYAGVANPVVDALIEKLIAAETYKQLLVRAHALDRALLWGYYMIPAWHAPGTMLAYWDRFDKPEIHPKYHPISWQSWWFNPEKSSKIKNNNASEVQELEVPAKTASDSWFQRVKHMIFGK